MNKAEYEARVAKLEAEGLTTSDAQAVIDAEEMPAPTPKTKAQKVRDALQPTYNNARNATFLVDAETCQAFFKSEFLYMSRERIDPMLDEIGVQYSWDTQSDLVIWW